jgi:glutamate dehydrogenase
MSLTNKTELASLIADIQAVAEGKLSTKEFTRLAPFFPLYFEEAEHGDLSRFSSLDLFGAAMAHYEFAARRAEGTHKIRIYNPDFERDGWQSTHSVIELVTDDMPFLIDSVAMFLARHNLNLHLLVHPVLEVARTDGLLKEVLRIDHGGQVLPRESLIHLQIDRQSDNDTLQALQDDLSHVVSAIRLVVSDEPKMRTVLSEIGASLTAVKGAHAEEAREAGEFLNWTADNHFLFMGYCDYDLIKADGQDRLKIVQGSGLGILQDQGGKEYSASFEQLPPQLRELAHAPQLIILNKSQTRSNIHRSAYVDFIGIKRFDSKGQVIGERRFLGLYTARAYQASPKDVPILRQKVDLVIKNCDFVDNSYKGKTLRFVLETYPRDELIEIPPETLAPIVEGIVNLQERPRVRLFVRTDRYHRYVSCLVYVPRDSFSTEVRLKIEKVLLNAFQGSSTEFSVQIGDGMLARVHYIIRTHASSLPVFREADIESEIERLRCTAS